MPIERFASATLWQIQECIASARIRLRNTCGADRATRACISLSFALSLCRLKKPDRPEIPRKERFIGFPSICAASRDSRTTPSAPFPGEHLTPGSPSVKSTQLPQGTSTYFGQFGTRGLGYDVEPLSRMITDKLGAQKPPAGRYSSVSAISASRCSPIAVSKRRDSKSSPPLTSIPSAKRDKQITQPILGMDRLAETITCAQRENGHSNT